MSSEPPIEITPPFDVYTVFDVEGNHIRNLGDYLNDPARAHQHARNAGAIVAVRSYVVVGDYSRRGWEQ